MQGQNRKKQKKTGTVRESQKQSVATQAQAGKTQGQNRDKQDISRDFKTSTTSSTRDNKRYSHTPTWYNKKMPPCHTVSLDVTGELGCPSVQITPYDGKIHKTRRGRPR